MGSCSWGVVTVEIRVIWKPYQMIDISSSPLITPRSPPEILLGSPHLHSKHVNDENMSDLLSILKEK